MSEKTVLIIATLSAKPGQGDALYEVVNRCVIASRSEAGNVHYDLYRSVENGDRFLVHETWKSAAAVELHESQPHFKALLEEAGPLLAAAPSIVKI